LIRRIYAHAIEEGWVEKNSVVIDPFGGVALGSLEAMRRGLHWVGVELEARFCALAQQNIDLWNSRYAKQMPHWGTAVIVQGDSRRLGEVLAEANICLSSPPYAGSLGDGKSGIDWSKQADRETAHPHGWNGENYGQQPGQLAQMPEGDLALSISSPPYAISPVAHCESGSVAQRWRDTGTTLRQRSGGRLPSEQYSEDTTGQLAQMPPGDHAAALEAEAGRPVACVSSPPWENMAVAAGDQARDKGFSRYDPSTRSAPKRNGLYAVQFGDMKGQLGNETGSTFWAASRQILEQVYQVLAPGGHAIFVCKRFVRAGKIIEFSTQWAHLCEAVGFKWIHHHKAWLVEDRGAQHTLEGGLEKREVRRLSFFRRLHTQKYPHLAILWEDVLCFVKEA